MEKNTKNSYQIRKAAGLYWILKMNQSGQPYEEPIPVNEVGADIFLGMEAGKEPGEIAEELSRKYHGPKEEIEKDVLEFMKQLRERGDYR